MQHRWCTHKLGFWGVVLIPVKKDDKEGYASGMAYLASDMLIPFEFAVGRGFNSRVTSQLCQSFKNQANVKAAVEQALLLSFS